MKLADFTTRSGSCLCLNLNIIFVFAFPVVNSEWLVRRFVTGLKCEIGPDDADNVFYGAFSIALRYFRMNFKMIVLNADFDGCSVW